MNVITLKLLMPAEGLTTECNVVEKLTKLSVILFFTLCIMHLSDVVPIVSFLNQFWLLTVHQVLQSWVQSKLVEHLTWKPRNIDSGVFVLQTDTFSLKHFLSGCSRLSDSAYVCSHQRNHSSCTSCSWYTGSCQTRTQDNYQAPFIRSPSVICLLTTLSKRLPP